jgi:uncharacterized repeat protein (TIGR01451 family)
MLKKLFSLFCAILIAALMFASFASAAPAIEYSGPKQLKPQLSSDGKTFYNAIPAIVYVVDPNPPKSPVRIPPLFKLSTLPEKATATLAITYVPDGDTDLWGKLCYTFPEEAKAAFNAAAALWGNLLQSSVPITINACWADLGSSSSILGYSGGGNLLRDFTGAPRANTWYAVSLANALAGSDLVPSNFDMHITYNRYFSWYYGTDGATPAGQYDFMSVVLHEIAHGLNFSGSMSYAGGSGSWGYSTGHPNIYDTFMRDGTANPGRLLIDTGVYPNPSTALGTALTSQSIWFHGANAMAANSGQRVKMYAPSTWAAGSSYSHLDYATFSGGANRLMVYAISSGVSIHDPGPVALGMLKDMGWPGASAVVADVAIAITDTPDPIIINGNLTYTIVVSNNGPNAAAGVIMADNLPTGVTYVSATPSQGTCIGTSTVTCALGSISSGTDATVTLVVTPTFAVLGLTNTASITSSSSSDPNQANNSATASTTVNNPVPGISSLNPSSSFPGGAAFTLTVNGTNFLQGSQVQWNGLDRATTFVSSTQLTAEIPAADITATGTIPVTVVNPAPGGGTSSAYDFSIMVQVPGEGSGGGGGGCFIATAAYGSYCDPHVQVLRNLRDGFLVHYAPGRIFLNVYYRYSPPIADFIREREGLKCLVRGVITPIVYVIKYPYAIGCMLIPLAFMLIRKRRKK